MNNSFEPMTLRDHFEESAKLAQDVLQDAPFLASMEEGAHVLIEALRAGHKVLSCGNGGSMCDAMHFAEELSGRYREDRKPFAFKRRVFFAFAEKEGVTATALQENCSTERQAKDRRGTNTIHGSLPFTRRRWR